MKILKTLLSVIGLLGVLLALVYLLGPRPDYPAFDAQIPTFDIPLEQLDAHVAAQEAKVENIKPNNQARIIWADSVRKTNYAVLYLHGFSASPMEGDPTHEKFAARYGCNLYIPRLAQHGIEHEDIFADLTPKDLVESAKEAVALARQLGDTLILMSCSTGSTLGNYLAAENPDLFYGHIMYSPNFDLADPRSGMLTRPWGLQIARHLLGDRRKIDYIIGTPRGQYTTNVYRVEGLICLKALIQETMQPSIYKKVKTPYLLAYYYKNENQQDQIISIDAIKKFHALSGTADEHKQLLALPDVGNHVLPSDLYSKDLEAVNEVTYSFAEKVLKLKPVL